MVKIYFVVAFVCSVLAYFSTYGKPPIQDKFGELQKKRQRIFFYILLVFILVSFAGFRKIYAGGMDEYAYRARFDKINGMSLSEALAFTPSEPLISLVFYIATRIFDTSQGVLLLTSILTLVPIVYSFSKYSIDFAYAVVLLFATGQVYSMFNGIAQYLAAAIYLFAIPYIYKRQFWKYLLVVAICCMFHMASIILIPVYFIALNRTDSIKGIGTSVIVLVALIIAYSSLGTIISTTGMLDNYMFVVEEGHHGVNIITIAINCVPAALAIFTGSRTKDDKATTVCANMCILHALIYIASFMDVYIARFALFTCTFVILYLSRITKVFSNEFKIIFKVASVVLYSIVCYLLIHNARYILEFRLFL